MGSRWTFSFDRCLGSVVKAIAEMHTIPVGLRQPHTISGVIESLQHLDVASLFASLPHQASSDRARSVEAP